MVLQIEVSKELDKVDRMTLEKERYTVGDLLTRSNDVLSSIQTTEHLHPGDDTTLIYTRPLKESENADESVASKGVKRNKVTI